MKIIKIAATALIPALCLMPQTASASQCVYNEQCFPIRCIDGELEYSCTGVMHRGYKSECPDKKWRERKNNQSCMNEYTKGKSKKMRLLLQRSPGMPAIDLVD